ncbi:MAG: LysM peptidoglycan-binding domain-containing protein [Clostridiaceae bacterium]|nr:LysM peptidoglycan-binding domain-containing protein [Clostridiaceae bacterium]
MVIYVVRQGDSLYRIAQNFGVSYQQIAEDNQLQNPNVLVVGQTIIIMTDTILHTVMPGQSLYSIARGYRVKLSDLINANPQITNPAMLSVGQRVNIPVGAQRLGTMEVNGYAFPNITSSVLQSTLPYLTYLSIFSYQINPDGSLTDITDEPLIQAARQAKVAPIMVITNLENEGGFSSDLAHTIFASTALQETLIDNIITVLQNKNYHGVDIDFEYIYPYDRQSYNNFVAMVVERLHPLGYSVATALAPKTSGAQTGLLYEAHDYPFHGTIVDRVILMTYEWGYTYGPPMAVSPLNQVRRVLNYATSVIPSEKILMGMPNYGYDWTLPYVSGTAARTVSNAAAVTLAAENKAQIQYDTTAQAPFFNYTYSNGAQHVVWFQDARSVAASLRLVPEYNLAGVSYWTINRFTPQNWLVLGAFFNVKKVI